MSSTFSTKIALPNQLVGFLLADTLAGESLNYLANFSGDYQTLTLSSHLQENLHRAEQDVRAKVKQLEREIQTREVYLHSMYVPLLANVQGERDMTDMETLFHVKVSLTERKLSIQQFQRTLLSFAQQDPTTRQCHFFTKDLSNLAVFRLSGELSEASYFPLSPNAQSSPRPIWSYSQPNGRFASFDMSQSQLLENFLHYGGSQIVLFGAQWVVDFSAMALKSLSSGQIVALQREPPVLGLPVQHVVVNIQGLDTCIESAKATLQGRLEKRLKALSCPILVNAPARLLELQQQVANYCRQFCVEFSLEATAQLPMLSLTGAEGYVDRVQENVVDYIHQLLSQVGLQTTAVPSLPLGPHSPRKDDSVPKSWISQSENCIFGIVGRNCAEWNEFEGLLRKTLSSIRIYALERVQNRILWERYSLEGRQMKERNEGEINEKFLFHGTSKMDPYKIAKSESGIDFRCSSQDRRLMWGKGAYFASKASYSDQYSYKLPDGKRQMLIVSVLTGHSRYFGKTTNERLTRPPERSSGKLYDTVHGMVNDCDIYVVYDHSKSYPAYVVTYTRSTSGRRTD